MKAWAISFDSPQPYDEIMALQDQLVESRRDEQIPDTVLFLQHTPVVTLGCRGRTEHLKLTQEQLAELGISLFKASRGGDVTFHGPGQLVIYPVLRLGVEESDARGHLNNLEEVAIRLASDFGVGAYRREGLNGAWTDQGKIAAIGFRLRRGVTYHGMSFNVAPDLSGFSTITPCGLKGESVTSLKDLLGEKCPSLAQVQERAMFHFASIFSRPLELICPSRVNFSC